MLTLCKHCAFLKKEKISVLYINYICLFDYLFISS